MSNRLFRRLVAPAVAAVTYVQTGSYVYAIPPTNIQEDANYLDSENDYNYPLKVFCEKCGWIDCTNLKDCLAKVKTELNYSDKIPVGFYLIPQLKKYSLFLDVDSCGKSASGKKVNIILTLEDFAELWDEFNVDDSLFKVNEWDSDDLKNTKEHYAKRIKEIKLKKYLKIGAVTLSTIIAIGLIAAISSKDNNDTVQQKRFARNMGYKNYQQNDYDEYDDDGATDDDEVVSSYNQ